MWLMSALVFECVTEYWKLLLLTRPLSGGLGLVKYLTGLAEGAEDSVWHSELDRGIV